MSFHEVRFPDDVSQGSAGGPGYSTNIIDVESGNEERTARWAGAKRKYDVAYGIKTPAQLSSVQGFYIAREGPVHGFRYKDWIDYATTPSGNTHHSGEAVTALDQTLVAVPGGLATQFQLVKRYTSGPATKIRYLTKPVLGTVLIAVSGTPTVSFVLDSTTGVITLGGIPAGPVTGGCEFDVPVRFGKEVDEAALMASYQNFGWGEINTCPLVEIFNGLKLAEDANCGMSAEVCLTTDYQIAPGIARFIVFEPNAPSLKAFLPDTTDLPPGGPMFWLLCVGPNAIDLYTHEGVAFSTLQIGDGVVLALTVDGSDTKIWYML